MAAPRRRDIEWWQEMRRQFENVSSTLARIVPWAWVFLLLIMMMHVVANGLLRKFLNAPLEGTNEWTQYWYMPLIAFGGFVLTEMRDEHIEARFVFDKLPAGVQAELQLLSRILVTVLCASFTWFGFLEALDAFQAKLTGGVIGLPIWPVTFAGPIAFAVMTIIGLVRVGDAVRVFGGRGPRQVASAREGTSNEL